MKRNETKKKQGHVSAPGENLKDEEQVEASGGLTYSENKTQRILSVLDENDVTAVVKHIESPKESCKDLSDSARYALLLICSLIFKDPTLEVGALALKESLEHNNSVDEILTTVDEVEVVEAVKELKSHLHFVSEANQVALAILTDILPEIETAITEVNVEAAVVRYAKTHDFKETWSGALIYGLKESVKDLSKWPVAVREQALAKLTKETESLVQKRRDVQKAEKQFALIIDALDLRTKLIILTGQKLTALSGINIDCFSHVWYAFRRQDEDILSKVKDSELWQDEDIRFLYDAYVLADTINNAAS